MSRSSYSSYKAQQDSNSKMQHKKTSSRQKFTAEEDRLLESLVNELGTHAWKKVSARMKTRSTRQCRERYTNYLAPNVTNGPWTAAEDALLEQKVQEMGQKWSKIASFFEGRSDVNIKNRHALLVSKGLAVPGVSFHRGFKAKRRAMEANEQKPVNQNIQQQTIQNIQPQTQPFDYSAQVLPQNAANINLYQAANDFLTKWFEGQDKDAAAANSSNTQQQQQQQTQNTNQDWNKVNFDFETEWLLNQQLSDPSSIFCTL